MASGQVTVLLNQVKKGDKHILNKVYALLYADIKSIAGFQLIQLQTGETITPTVLAHECYLKLLKRERITVENKRHFLNCLAKTMRQFLIDTLRAKSSHKRNSQPIKAEITEFVGDDDVSIRLIEINLMLEKVEQVDKDLADLLQYKLIFNLNFKEIGEIFKQSERQIMRQWKQAKALLLGMVSERAKQHV